MITPLRASMWPPEPGRSWFSGFTMIREKDKTKKSETEASAV